MAYRFRRKERLPRAVRRVGREELDAAVGQLANGGAQAPEAVHDARKRIKKVRALARLVRDDLGKQYSADNTLLRDAARQLAGARDAQVLVETFDKLANDHPEAASNGAAQIRHTLVGELELSQQQCAQGDAPSVAIEGLEIGRQHVADWPVGKTDWKTIRSGLKRTYKRGRRTMSTARETPTDETFHEWRKRVKDLWYDMRLLEGAWKPVLHGWVKELDRLSDLLGDDHDLAVFIERVGAESASGNGAVAELIEAAYVQRAGKQAEAIALGHRIYAERPGSFADRVSAYWRAWRA